LLTIGGGGAVTWEGVEAVDEEPPQADNNAAAAQEDSNMKCLL
jgi:hypothetical protein